VIDIKQFLEFIFFGDSLPFIKSMYNIGQFIIMLFFHDFSEEQAVA
jgi:hypothetical protein